MKSVMTDEQLDIIELRLALANDAFCAYARTDIPLLLEEVRFWRDLFKQKQRELKFPNLQQVPPPK